MAFLVLAMGHEKSFLEAFGKSLPYSKSHISLSPQLDMNKKPVALTVTSAFKQPNEEPVLCWPSGEMERIWAMLT